MKRKLTPAFINAQPVPASAVHCLHYRPPGLAVFSLPRNVPTSENAIAIGQTGSGKIFAPQAIPNSMPSGPPPGVICADYWVKSYDAAPNLYRYLQHSEKGRVS